MPELVDPALAPPILDLSESTIDLEVDPDEDLPPEHIAVINRGGGTLDWTVESSAPWVEPVADGMSVVLHLHPGAVPGPRRANVYVRDTPTGALKTIRISVPVRDPAESTTGSGTGPASGRRWGDPLRWAGLASVVVGGIVVGTGIDLETVPGESVWLRSQETGAGVQLSVLGGALLTVAGLIAAVRPRWQWPIGACLGLAVPLGLVRLAENAVLYGSTEANTWFRASSALALALGAWLVVELRRTLWRPASWAPRPLVHWSLVLAVLWGGALIVDAYHQDLLKGTDYGGVFTGTVYDGYVGVGGVVRLVAAAAVLALLYSGFRRLPRPIGPGVVVGVAITPLLGAVHEITYLVASDEHPDGARLLALTFTPAMLLAVLVVAGVVITATAPSDADAGSSGATVRSTGRMVRSHPLRAVGVGGATVALVATATLLLPAGRFGEQVRILEPDGTSPRENRNAFSPTAIGWR